MYAKAAAVYLGLDYLTDLQWEKLKEEVSGKGKSVEKKKKSVQLLSRGLEN